VDVVLPTLTLWTDRHISGQRLRQQVSKQLQLIVFRLNPDPLFYFGGVMRVHVLKKEGRVPALVFTSTDFLHSDWAREEMLLRSDPS